MFLFADFKCFNSYGSVYHNYNSHDFGAGISGAQCSNPGANLRATLVALVRDKIEAMLVRTSPRLTRTVTKAEEQEHSGEKWVRTRHAWTRADNNTVGIPCK